MTIGQQWQKNVLISSEEDISPFSNILKEIFGLLDRCRGFLGPNGSPILEFCKRPIRLRVPGDISKTSSGPSISFLDTSYDVFFGIVLPNPPTGSTGVKGVLNGDGERDRGLLNPDEEESVSQLILALDFED